MRQRHHLKRVFIGALEWVVTRTEVLMSRFHPLPASCLASLALALGAPLPGHAQLTKPTQPALTVIVGPSSLTATAKTSSILLTFPGVTGASGYRVTRTNNAGDPETIIFEGPLDQFTFQGAACSSSQGCAYNDAAVVRGYLYSYRVYSLFPNSSGPPIVSPPSPVASAQLMLVGRVR